MRHDKVHIICFLLGVALVSRLIPHPPNFTPLIGLCLLAGRELKQITAIIILILGLIISDGLIAWLHHFPWFGSWTFFTYSGFVAAIWLGQSLRKRMPISLPIFSALISGFGFWLWTNFGVWLTSSLYPLSINGLTTCYIAALPFLRNELLGDFCWGIIIFGSYIWVQKNAARMQCGIFQSM